MRSRNMGSALKSYEPSASAITITSPVAAANPPMYAAPYPRRRSLTTRAPAAAAASGEPSLDPLFTTMTSPSTPAAQSASVASFTTSATVAISLRQGRTTETRSLTAVEGIRASRWARVRARASFRGGGTAGVSGGCHSGPSRGWACVGAAAVARQFAWAVNELVAVRAELRRTDALRVKAEEIAASTAAEARRDAEELRIVRAKLAEVEADGLGARREQLEQAEAAVKHEERERAES